MKISSATLVFALYAAIHSSVSHAYNIDDILPPGARENGYVPAFELPPVELETLPAYPCPGAECIEVDGDATQGGRRAVSLGDGNDRARNLFVSGGSDEIDFEGIGNEVAIQDTFDSIGLEFDPFAFGIVDKDNGGSGRFANEPSPDTAMYFPQGSFFSSIWLPYGLKTFGFSYSSATDLSRVTLFYAMEDDPFGFIIFPIEYVPLDNNHDIDCTGDPTGAYCNWSTAVAPERPGQVIKRIIFEGAFIPGGFESSICFLMIDNMFFTYPGTLAPTSAPTEAPRPGGGGGNGGAGGDPHFLRWQQDKRNSFHGECDLVLIEDSSFKNGQGLDIHLRTTIHEFYSYIEAAAIRVGNSILEFQMDSFSVDGNKHSYEELPFLYSHGADELEIVKNEVLLANGNTRKGLRFNLTEDSHVDITFTKRFMSVNLKGREEDLGESKGLLGEFTTGDMIGRSGQVFEDFQDFSFEWQVSQEDPQLFSHAREPQLPYEKCRLPSLEQVSSRRLRQGNKELQESAENACAGSSDFDLCVNDVLTTGEIGVADVFF